MYRSEFPSPSLPTSFFISTFLFVTGDRIYSRISPPPGVGLLMRGVGFRGGYRPMLWARLRNGDDLTLLSLIMTGGMRCFAPKMCLRDSILALSLNCYLILTIYFGLIRVWTSVFSLAGSSGTTNEHGLTINFLGGCEKIFFF